MSDQEIASFVGKQVLLRWGCRETTGRLVRVQNGLVYLEDEPPETPERGHTIMSDFVSEIVPISTSD